MNDYVIEIKNIVKVFKVGTQNVLVLDNVSMTVNEGDFLIIYGPSGCGKSTLLHVLLGLEEPTSGEIYVFNKNIYNNTSEDDRSEFRKNNIGMIYQQPNWVKSLSVLENIAFPLLLLGLDKMSANQKAAQLLTSIGMMDWADYFTSELSSGQQQKIALARALIIDPKIIVADEPTGNLDFKSGQELMQLLSAHNENGKTVIMVTHDLEYLKYARQAVKMFNGRIVEEDKKINKETIMNGIKTKRGRLTA